MSTYDKASLVLIPSGTKEGVVFSQKPTNGDGDFTFTRASSATRVNSDGLIEKETQNLLLQSNQFDTTWTNSVSTETGGQSGYDGSSDAWLLSKSGNGGRIYQNVAVSNLNTFSVYAKANTLNWVSLWTNIGTSYFDLENGVVGDITASTSITSNIESVGNGWYRCSFVFNTTISQVRIYPADGNLDTSGSSGSIYIQDAQLNQGLVADPYLETTTAAVYGGITDNIPRLDYTDASCPSLLLEGQRTNAVPYSEYFNTGWSKDGSSVTSNAATSPEGLQNATKLVEDTSTGLHMLSYTNLYVVGAGDDNYLTLYAKEGERRYLAISSRGNFSNNDNTLIFDTRDGVWTNNDSNQNTGQDPINVGNGWWRIQVLNESISASYDGFGIGIAETGDNWTGASYTGDGTSGIYIWGAQAEIGSYATSYIPTYGASVTFASDSMQIASGISDLLPQGTGTMYIEATIADAVDTEGYLMRIEQGSFADTIFILRGANGNLGAYYRNGNSTIIFLEKINVADTFKAAFAFESGNSVLYVNGEQVGTSSVTYTPLTTYNDIRIGGYSPSAANMSGVVSQSLVFKTRLSNEELATLTTI